MRLPYPDRLKAWLVAGVIFGHAWAGYSTFQGAWVYTDVREATLRPSSQAFLEALLGPFALFAMGMFFLIAGLLTPPSLARKTPPRFALDRLLRLGLPLAAFTFVLWPPMRYALGDASWWSSPDPVQLWFAEVLLLFSLAYALVHRRSLPLPHPLTLSAVVAVASFVVRGWYPLNTDGPWFLHLCQWPQYVALFYLGVAANRHGWLTAVPDQVRRSCARAAVLGTLAIAAFALIVAVTGASPDDFLGGWHPAALATAAAEGLLSVNLAVWLLATAQRHLNRPLRSPTVASDAFAAFIVQAHVLVTLALLARPVPVPAELKALFVSVAGVLLSFALGHLVTIATTRRAPVTHPTAT
ncbi:acyltransferase [Dactylosporangium salmoneum]|uniref:Acyltransferase 3 domain-containing protein n=1 Tax=Dactylosporangium salmoneum TaxID=53361 RepID=A0ABP5V891_9ACTN